MVSDGTELAVGDIEKLFEEVRKNTKAKHEKWAKYYNRRSLESGKEINGQHRSSSIISSKKKNKNVIRVGNLDSSDSGYQTNSFEGTRPRSD
ncbi:hypothetical protein TNCV_3106861 [Trichonephila clavipes]|nr:hypothetical protein TNCV_3106861 [Trichonephila clavipes]